MNNEFSAANTTILVIDDNPTNLAILTGYLRQDGYQIMVSKNGNDGIEKARIGKPSLILLDIMMPDISGFETCIRLKSLEETKNIPVIFITALDNIEEKIKGFEIGGVDYITKPLQEKEVIVRVKTHIEIRNLQKKLEGKVRELEISNMDLEAYAHSVAHDLKNPIACIKGYAELLLYSSDNEIKNREKIIGHIIQNSNKMTQIIDSLLLFAKIRENDAILKPLNMLEIINNTREHLFEKIKASNAKFDIPDSMPVTLGNPELIENVWNNYISNALKYGGNPPYIKIGFTILPKTNYDESFIKFWITDNGEGLSIENQAKLFKPFSRVHGSDVEGTGLGLTIVQRIVEKLGGLVGMESNLGMGSTFYFTLRET